MPAVSVVIVADYHGGDDKGWQDMAETLRALARQDFDEPVEFILAECAEAPVPAEICELVPALHVLHSIERSSYALKNAGARAAQADIVGILDGDCVPHPRWLRSMVSSLRKHTDFSVVSGRTVYAGNTVTERIYGMLARGYLDRGGINETDSVANNNCGFRRTVLLEVPFPDDVGAFGEKLHVQNIRRAGQRMLFDPRMLTTHAYDGWDMEKDIRRNSGFSVIKVRQIDPGIRFAALTRLGILSIPAFFLGRTVYDWWNVIRWGRHYGIAWYQQPLALGLAVVVHILEIPGMSLALRGKSIGESGYR